MALMELTCEHCGMPAAADDRFCGNCGKVPASVPADPAATSAFTQVPAVPAQASGSWAGRLTGSAPIPADPAITGRVPHEYYLGHRLAYDQAPEGSFDPVFNLRLLAQFALRGWLYGVIYAVAGGAAAVLLLILAVLGTGFGVAVTLWWIGAAAVGLLFLMLFLLIPVHAQLSEWKFFVDGQAQAAPVAFDHMAWALQQRQTPLDAVQVRRLRLAGRQSRDYLELRRDLFTGVISCFAYGNDLYIGWTFWLRLSFGRWLLMLAARLLRAMTHRGDEMYVSLRYDYARAMREAMHSVARQGVGAAAGDTRPEGQQAVSTLPVVDVDVTV
jgi:hypothetical protein